METMTFSKRLYSVPAILIILALNVSYSVQTVRHFLVDGTDEGLVFITVGFLVFTLLGTVGWRYCLRQQSALLLRAYLAVETGLLIWLFWYENEITRTGSAIGALSLTVLLQSAVLGWWSRGSCLLQASAR